MVLAVAVSSQEEHYEEEGNVPVEHYEERFEEHVEVDASGEVYEPVECDCNEQIVVALQPVVNDKDELWHQLQGVREELNGCVNDKDGLYQEVEQLRKSLEQSRKDAESWSVMSRVHESTAQEKHGIVEEKVRHLGEMESKMKAVEAELLLAKEEIKNLSEVSFVTQLKKELEALWQSIIQFWQNLMAKKEE